MQYSRLEREKIRIFPGSREGAPPKGGALSRRGEDGGGGRGGTALSSRVPGGQPERVAPTEAAFPLILHNGGTRGKMVVFQFGGFCGHGALKKPNFYTGPRRCTAVHNGAQHGAHFSESRYAQG